MHLVCGGRHADVNGRLVGPVCGATWSAPAGVDPHQAARAARWRVGHGTAMCPRCSRRRIDSEDDDPAPTVTGGEQLMIELSEIPGPTPAVGHGQ